MAKATTLEDRRNYAAARAAMEKITTEMNELRINAQHITIAEVCELEDGAAKLADLNDACIARAE